MNNGYNVEILEEYGTLKVFLEPQCGHELHRKKRVTNTTYADE